MANYKAEVTLNEKDSLQDMLNLEKTMVKLYATAWTEGASKGFRNLTKNHIEATAADQLAVFMSMTEHGYYKVESAEETELSKEKSKFSKVKSQLG